MNIDTNAGWANRSFNIQRLYITEQNRAVLQRFINRDTPAGTLFPHKIPTFTALGADTFSVSPETSAKVGAQQAAGLPARELPEGKQSFRHSDFRIFAEKVLSPHMDDADRFLGNLEAVIADPSRQLSVSLSLAERTMVRESLLQEARYIAAKYLGEQDGQRFIDGVANLIREAEMKERGYVIEGGGDQNNISFRRPFDEADNHARLDFLEDHLTDAQRALIAEAIAERDRLWNELAPALRGEGENGQSLSLGEMMDARAQNPQWQAFGEATMAVRALFAELAEYHGFNEQWQAWQAGDAADDNWFVRAEASFAENSEQVAGQIEEVRLNFHSQLNQHGMDGFRSILEQLRLNSTESMFWDWLMQLRVFGATNSQS